MAITKKLKEDLKMYNINLPTNGRTKEFKKQVDRYRIKELYIAHLRDLVRDAKQKEKKIVNRKIKFYQKQVVETKYKHETFKVVFDKMKLQKYRNKLFYMLPTESSWKSYFQYSIYNDTPDLVGIPHMTEEEVLYEQHSFSDYDPPHISEDDLQKFMSFYQVFKFLTELVKKQKQFKVNVAISFLAVIHHEPPQSFWFKSKNKIIRNKKDIIDFFNDLSHQYYSKTESDNDRYINCFRLNEFSININTINPSSGGTYSKLPDFIANKKAITNINNSGNSSVGLLPDNKCFLYSVLCGIKKEPKNAERVSKYTDRLNELSYLETDFRGDGMDINRIRFFEMKNHLRINVFGLEDDEDEKCKAIIPLYTSCFRNRTDYKLINLFYYRKHYSCINDLNRLLRTGDKKHRVCPYCCEFSSDGGGSQNAMDKHMSYCISGQRIEMPKVNIEDNTIKPIIKFSHYNNLTECPIRIYADFETYNDCSMKHKSINNKTTFKTGHKPASFKLMVVSDILIEDYEKIGNFYTKSIVYKGTDADDVFVQNILKLEDTLTTIIKERQELNRLNIKMTPDNYREYHKCKSCWICKKQFTEDNVKVRHHNHITGEYHSPLCKNCNLQIKERVKIPVIFHNLNYDKNVFLKSLIYNAFSTFNAFNTKETENKKMKMVNILPDNTNSFKSFTAGNLNFIDSFRFMSSSLAKLMKNLPDDNKPFLKHLSNGDNKKMKYVENKGYFPYEWFDSIYKLNSPIEELKMEHFKNDLTLEELKADEWDYIQELIKYNNITTFEEFHDFYLDVDVNGLVDVFENFRQTSLEYYKIDPCHYVGTPSFAWDAMLLRSGIELELLTDSDMYLFFERGIRGGMSCIFKKLQEANNKYLKVYDKSKKTNYIIYLDANNLYGVSMSDLLPFRGFKWVDGSEITVDMIKNYDEKSKNGMVLEVDLEYPSELHDKHNDYPLAPVRMKLGNCEKLCGTLEDKKDYIVHIKNLKFYLEQGMKITKIHRAISFEQSDWLKEWIDFNTDKRKVAKNDFEKDYFKLMNNAVFGKTMENVRDRIKIKVAFSEEYHKKYQSKPNCIDTIKYTSKSDKFFHLEVMEDKLVKLNKPIYAGFSILDLSKLHMFKFHYEYMKPKYGDNLQLLMTDTDSLVYNIETDDFYQDMKDNSSYFDMSGYSIESGFYNGKNEKELGKFKDEVSSGYIKEFVAVRPKCYSFITDKGDETKKLKGIPKAVLKHKITAKDYRDCIEGKTIEPVQVHSIRTKDMCNYSLKQTKKALTDTDDKRVWFGTNSLAYGNKMI